MTIGEFSNITGLTIKALRYYDRINILKPSYINEETGYRYYKRNQMQFANILLLASTLDIPLKKLSEYMKEDEIEYDALLEYAKKEITNKINDLRYHLDVVNHCSDIQKRQSSCTFEKYQKFDIPEIKVIMIPFDGEINTPEFDKKTAEFFDQYRENELGAYYGLLHIKEDGIIRKYIFGEATPYTKPRNRNHVLYTFEKGTYECKLDHNPINPKDFSSVLLIMETFLPYKDEKTIYEIMKR